MFNLPSVSIIIPVLNEQSRIADALAAFESQARGQGVEVIVVDGGSNDRTAEIARSFDFVRFTVVEPANRGGQMNQGARMATGETLLFLHADVTLPRQSPQQYRSCRSWSQAQSYERASSGSPRMERRGAAGS